MRELWYVVTCNIEQKCSQAQIQCNLMLATDILLITELEVWTLWGRANSNCQLKI